MSLARDTLVNWVSQVGQMGVIFITGIVVGRILGPARYGVYNAIGIASMLIVNMTSLGAQASASYFFSDKNASFPRIHTIFIWLMFVIMGVEAVVGLFFGDFIRVKIMGDLDTWLIWIVVLTLPLAIYQFIGYGILVGIKRLETLARFNFYTTFVPCILNVLVILYFPRETELERDKLLVWMVWIWVLDQIISDIYLLVVLGRNRKMFDWVPVREALRELWVMIVYGSKAFYGNFANTIVNRFDQIIMLSALNPTNYGLYARGKSLALMLIQPSTALQRAGFAEVRQGTSNESARLVRELARANFLLVFPVIVLLMSIGKPFIVFFYGPEWAGSAIVMILLMPGVAMSAMARMLALYFTAHKGKPQISSNATWTAAFVSLGLLWYFVFKLKWGMVGGALAATAGNAALVCILWLRFCLVTGLWNPLPFFLPRRSDWGHLMRVTKQMLAGKK